MNFNRYQPKRTGFGISTVKIDRKLEQRVVEGALDGLNRTSSV